MDARRLKRLAASLFVALAVVLGYASWRGWLPGVADFSEIDARQDR